MRLCGIQRQNRTSIGEKINHGEEKSELATRQETQTLGNKKKFIYVPAHVRSVLNAL